MISICDSTEWSRIYQLINLLENGGFHSGEKLGQVLGVSRAAVWKNIKRLEELGLKIESVKGKGYRLPQKVELLHESTILQLLMSASEVGSIRINIFPEIESTNNFLLHQHDIHARICLAEKQTGGRGRRGRVWVSPFAQNIYLSIGWRFESDISILKGLSLLVGCSIVRVLKHLGFTQQGLKWPNDVLANARKLAGVLVDIRGDLEGDCEVVIGIGLNYNMQSETHDISQPWIDLNELSSMENISLPPRNLLAAMLIKELFGMLHDYGRLTFSFYKSEWESYNLHQGKLVEILIGDKSVTGICLGIDMDGALLVRDVENQLHILHGGEVSLRDAK